MNGYLTAEDIIARTTELVGGRTGLIGSPMELLAESGNPEIIVYSSPLCRLQNALPHIQLQTNDGLIMAGSGSSTERDLAKAKAICEALERYCNISFDPNAVRVATRNELGEEALDLTLFHRGHENEYSIASSHVPPDNDQKIRWVKGKSLVSGKDLWVPFSAVYIATPYLYPGESFVIPISTGSALAASYERAAVSGTLELIERDTLSLVWLQQLRLKRIDYSGCRNPEFLQRASAIAAAGIDQHFFDATTDLGFPTAYLLQVSRQGDLHVLVMAASRLDMEDAMIRVMDEASASRAALEKLARKPPLFDPSNFKSFTRLTDGAVYYADPKNIGAFDFLLKDPDTIRLEDTVRHEAKDDRAMLDTILSAFRRNGMELVCADLTTPQLSRIGLRVVRMIAPQMLPLTVNYNMKYGGTPRLYEAPRRMGHPVREFQDLNNWPQPFA